MKSDLFKQLVWDYNLTQDEFEAILHGKKVLGNMNQSWAIVRVLENLNYYDAMNLISLDMLRNNWSKVKNYQQIEPDFVNVEDRVCYDSPQP